MNIQITIICAFVLSACVNSNQTTRSLQAIDLTQVDQSKTPLLIQKFSNLCLNPSQSAKSLLEAAHSAEWKKASQNELKQQGLAKLTKITLKIPGGGAPIEESQTILSKSFEGQIFILEISERYDPKRLTSTNCTLYGKQDEFLKNCAELGKLINQTPDQNTKYKESEAHFIGWNALLSGKQAKIKCQQTPNSPTLPYKGTQLSVSTDHITQVKVVKKSNPQQFDVSGR